MCWVNQDLLWWELSSEDSKLYWFLLLIFLHLLLAIWLSLLSAHLDVSDSGLALLQVSVSAFLRDKLSSGRICVPNALAPCLFWALTEMGRILSQTFLWLLCPEGSGHVPPSRCVGLTCALWCVSSLVKPALPRRDAGIQSCGTASEFCYIYLYKFCLLMMFFEQNWLLSFLFIFLVHKNTNYVCIFIGAPC